MTRRDELLRWLREEDPDRLEELWLRADSVRREEVGDEVHLRGLVELSNHCVRACAYCGVNATNRAVERYRMTADEVLSCAREAAARHYGTLVLQAGEDYGLTRTWVADLVRAIKRETLLAVTLSLGERPDEDLAAWRKAGADRYLLRFETSDRVLYGRIHPSLGTFPSDRVAILRRIDELGFQVGSGVMVGIPGQTHETLADDLELFRTLDLDMIGVGPFLPHPATLLGKGAVPPAVAGAQVPATELMTYKMVALARLVRPDANIPSTTALATLNLENGRELGLSRGANVVMPNLTPARYRALYEIYPAKACLRETTAESAARLVERITAMGRRPAKGPGGRRNPRRDRGRPRVISWPVDDPGSGPLRFGLEDGGAAPCDPHSDTFHPRTGTRRSRWRGF